MCLWQDGQVASTRRLGMRLGRREGGCGPAASPVWPLPIALLSTLGTTRMWFIPRKEAG